MSIIAEVFQAYGRYDLALETAYVKAQQMPAPQSVVPLHVRYRPKGCGERAGHVCGLLALKPGQWWSVNDVLAAVPWMGRDSVRLMLVNLAKRGDVEAWAEPWPCQHGYRWRYRHKDAA